MLFLVQPLCVVSQQSWFGLFFISYHIVSNFTPPPLAILDRLRNISVEGEGICIRTSHVIESCLLASRGSFKDVRGRVFVAIWRYGIANTCYHHTYYFNGGTSFMTPSHVLKSRIKLPFLSQINPPLIFLLFRVLVFWITFFLHPSDNWRRRLMPLRPIWTSWRKTIRSLTPLSSLRRLRPWLKWVGRGERVPPLDLFSWG